MTYSILHIVPSLILIYPDTVNKMEVACYYTLAQLTILYTYDDTERNRAPYVHVLFNKLTCVFVNPLLPHG